MNAFLIVGATRSGKSKFLKDKLKKASPASLLIYDINGEYDFYNKPFEDSDKFIQHISRVSNAIIVCEEATSFLDTRSTDKILTKSLVLKYHTKNTFFLVFHSFRDVPYYIFNKCTHVVLFKTNDSEQFVDSRFHNTNLTNAFKKIKSSPWNYTGKLYPNGQPIKYSDHLIVDIYATNED